LRALMQESHLEVFPRKTFDEHFVKRTLEGKKKKGEKTRLPESPGRPGLLEVFGETKGEKAEEEEGENASVR